MAFIRITRNSKPPLGTLINQEHPLAKNLVGAWAFNEEGGCKAFDACSLADAVITDALYIAEGLKFSNVAGNTVQTGKTYSFPTGYTQLAIVSGIDNAAKYTSFLNNNTSTATDSGFYFGALNGTLWASIGTSIVTGSAINYVGDYKKHIIATTWEPSTFHKIFVDGIEISYASATIATTYNDTANTAEIGTWEAKDVTHSSDSTIELQLVFNKALSDIEIKELSINPWQIFEPEVFIHTIAQNEGPPGPITGESSNTLDPVTKTQTGVIGVGEITGTSSNTLASVTKVQTGWVGIGTVVGESSKTLSSVSALQLGRVGVSSNNITTLDTVTPLQTGIITTAIVGSSSTTLDAVQGTQSGILYTRVATYSPIMYSIQYVSSISSSFETLGDFETLYESEYSVLAYDDIEAEFEALYSFASSGIIGITERIVGTWTPWEFAYEERPVHLHLYNTHVSEAQTTYERYFPIYSSKNIHVQRPLLFTERSTQLAFYDEYASQKNTFTSGLDEHFCIRYSQTRSYATHASNRTVVCTQMLTQTSERTSYLLEAYTSARTVFYKKWYETERWVATYAKEKSVYADQRNAFVQIVLNRFESIRMVGFEVCALSYPILINPSYVSYDIDISTSEVILFENEEVISTSENIYTLPIVTYDNSNGLVIISQDTENNPIIYTEAESLAFLTCEKILNTNTYRYVGDIVTVKETTFVKLILKVTNTGTFETPEEYLQYIQSVGYLKIEVAGKEASNGYATAIDVPAFTKIPVVIQAHSSVLENDNVNIVLRWAYPYNDAVINEILLIGVM